jgi:hypothetical protein
MLAAAGGCGGDEPTSSKNRPPEIRDVVVSPQSAVLGGQVRASVLASDPNGDPVTVQWRSAVGTFDNPAVLSAVWSAPEVPGDYTLVVTANDAEFTVSDSVVVQVGNASLVVNSDPPDAFIELDGVPLGARTPHRFPLLAAGPHTIRVTNPYYAYDHAAISVELVHGREDSVHFGIGPVSTSTLNLGRTDLLEIGGVSFLPGGTGIIYTGRTESGTGIFNSTLSPVPKPGNGARLIADVRLNEPLAISPDGTRIIFVMADGRLGVAHVRDDQGDGILDEVSDIRLLDLSSRYGPAISSDGRLAFTSSPSDEPAGAPIFWSVFQDTTLSGIRLATTTQGRIPTWEPGSDRLAYERDGIIVYTSVDESALSPSDTLVADGYSTAPAWGPYGPKHVAFLAGEGGDQIHDIRLAAVGTPHAVTLVEGIDNLRFLAWSPTQLMLAVTRNRAGRGEVVLVSGLPIP